MSDLASICEDLRAQPLFHLSLHSKELFHSNFLAWLCEAHPDAAVQVFSRWVPARPQAKRLRVQRERSNLDLAIELPGLTPLVVENKVFSPPDDQQLDDYANGPLAGLADPELLLLSLGRPRWPSDVHVSPNGR
ncbi:MAG: PD-(D/E)XK nuclease family protein [Acidimicrobiia bacterium]